MAKKNSPVDIKDSLILWIAYNFFDLMRQFSIFQQIRNIDNLIWNRKFKNKFPRPLTSNYLFPELWVIMNVILSFAFCLILPLFPHWAKVTLTVYAFLRIVEMLVYQVNVLLFDPIKGGASYRIKSATRMIILLMCNIMEYIGWFALVYICASISNNQDVSSLTMLLNSMMVFVNNMNPGELSDSLVVSIAYFESVVGFFMTLVCVARFISLLPVIQTIDNN